MSLSPKQSAFLAAHAIAGVVAESARAAGVGRRSHYEWLADPEYAAAFADADGEATERMEAEARRRAVDGALEPVIYQGQLCYEPRRNKRTGHVLVDKKTGHAKLTDKPLMIARKADNLLMFLLKSKRPHIYRDNATIEHTGAGGGPVSLTVEFVRPKAA